MITYKITAERNDDNGIKTTTIAFEYNNEIHQVDVPHFRPTTLEDIEIGIINRTYSGYTSDELNQKLALLSEEYNQIQEKNKPRSIRTISEFC